MHKVLVNRLGGLSLPRKSVVRLTDRPDMTLDVYRGRKTTKQQQQLDPSKNAMITDLDRFCFQGKVDVSAYILIKDVLKGRVRDSTMVTP